MANLFLKIDGIPGESLDSKHKDEIELVSFGWGVTQAVAETPGAGAGGGAAGRAHFQDFHFTMRVNKASPQLFLACASGKHIKEANLSVRRTQKEQVEYLKIKFTDLLVTSFQEGDTDGEVPQESIAFAFSRVQLEYRPQSARGAAGAALTAGWDLSKNVKL